MHVYMCSTYIYIYILPFAKNSWQKFWASALLRGRVLSSFFSASVCLSSLYLLAGFCGVGGMLTFIATATTQNVLLHFHTCYAAARSLALPHIRHATLLHVLLHFHTYVMLRCSTLSGMLTFVWTWHSLFGFWGWGDVNVHCDCNHTVRSLALPHIRHATLLHVLLHFHTYVMLRCCTALAHIRHATLLHVLLHFHTYVMLRCCTALPHLNNQSSCQAKFRVQWLS